MRRPRLPSAEEVGLWRLVVRDVAPIHDEPGKPPTSPVPPPETAKPVTIAEPPILPVPAVRRPNGLDGNSLRRLTKGERAIEASIDLHGMTLDTAHAALKRFIVAQAHAQRRCLLVITGKGGPERPGLLKREVPLWLAEWRPPVLAVVPAAPRHGGAGALYVLLQRRR
jgi:DNA-nicking Smr family endonuclease